MLLFLSFQISEANVEATRTLSASLTVVSVKINGILRLAMADLYIDTDHTASAGPSAF